MKAILRRAFPRAKARARWRAQAGWHPARQGLFCHFHAWRHVTLHRNQARLQLLNLPGPSRRNTTATYKGMEVRKARRESWDIEIYLSLSRRYNHNPAPSTLSPGLGVARSCKTALELRACDMVQKWTLLGNPRDFGDAVFLTSCLQCISRRIIFVPVLRLITLLPLNVRDLLQVLPFFPFTVVLRGTST